MAQVLPASGTNGILALADVISNYGANKAKANYDAASLQKMQLEEARAQEEEKRAAALHSYALDKADLDNQVLEQNLASEISKRNLQKRREAAMPRTATAATGMVMDRIKEGMPEWDLGASLAKSVAVEPADGFLPGTEFVQGDDGINRAYTSGGMDELGARQDYLDTMTKQVQAAASAASLQDTFDAPKFVEDTTKALDASGSGYRPMTPQEKAAYGIDPAAPAVMDPEGKPSVLSDGKTTVNIDNNASANKVADIMKDRHDVARAASMGLAAIENAGAALPGAITGFGANERLALQRLATYFGADPSSVVDTQTFEAAVMPLVSSTIKATVGSANISNADREFAERAVGGKITLDSHAIERLLNIMRAANSGVVRSYNETLDSVYPDNPENATMRSLYNDVPQAADFAAKPYGPTSPEHPVVRERYQVDDPSAVRSVRQIDTSRIPPEGIRRLIADPSPQSQAEFDRRFGLPGAAAQIIRQQNGGN